MPDGLVHERLSSEGPLIETAQPQPQTEIQAVESEILFGGLII